MKNLITALDNCLPQTQCGECGFPGCMPYAEALAQKNTPINRCPPGGAAAVNNLAKLLGIDPEPYLAEAKARERKPAVAVIREEECIGCTKCIQACPVDAIFGAAKKLHSIISDECTGCGLCIDPCPVDCIEMHPIEEARYEPEKAKQRFQAKKIRQLQQEQAQQQSYREKKRLAMQAVNRKQEILAKQDYILQALERVKNKRQSS